MATTVRQPFGELGTPRLQQLQNVKNRQNAITASHSAPAKSTFTFSSPLKRQHSPTLPSKDDAISVFDDNDSENIDPSVFLSPSKRAKNDHGLPTKKPHPSFSINVIPTVSSSTRPLSTPKAKPLRGSTPPPSARMTAPAGRSPQRPRIGRLSRNRRISAPVKRIDPPSFGTPRSTKSSPALPFSIDAALSGSLSSYKPQPQAKTSDALSSHPVSEYRKPMPKSWFFTIHEDTPEEEATNLMEHSACVLDISDDEEISAKKTVEDVKGKENVPPPDWVAAQPRMSSGAPVVVDAPIKPAPTARQAALAATLKHPADVHVAMDDAMALDPPPRSPLSDLAPEDFYAEGLDKDAVAVAPEADEQHQGASGDADAAAVEDDRDHAAEELKYAVETKTEILVYESDGSKEA